MTKPASFSSPFILLVLTLTLASLACAAPLTADLGQGLVYHRAHALPAELPSAVSLQAQPCILDLRYATGDSAAATALTGWLKFHATARAPVFILVNPETSSSLLTSLTRRDHLAGLVVLAPASPAFTPDIALAVNATTERAAYNAAEHGTALAKLLDAPPDKPRNDEAKLARDRQAASPASDSDSPVHPVVQDPLPGSSAVPPARPLVDVVLQRAVHLHRALLALKKI